MATLQSRLEALEARQRVIEVEDEPGCWQRADRDVDGNVVACERICFTHEPGLNSLGGASMTREPFSRTTCHFSECDHRDTCRADGSPTGWGKRKVEIGALP